VILSLMLSNGERQNIPRMHRPSSGLLNVSDVPDQGIIFNVAKEKRANTQFRRSHSELFKSKDLV